jgi:hypothetical protein
MTELMTKLQSLRHPKVFRKCKEFTCVILRDFHASRATLNHWHDVCWKMILGQRIREI